jgi:acetyltransferase-like isoleucine patch superfamily enzyme
LISNTSRSRAEATLESGGRESRLRLFLVRVVNYLTNHVVNHLPIFALRRWWYRSVLGVVFGEHAGVHLNCYVWFYSPGQIRRDGFRIGAFSRINRNCCLDVRGGLHIGDNVSISPDVMILTASHGIDDPEFRVETRPIVIEDHVYIGARATILPGVTLGRGCVVAACSTVTRDVPPLAIVAGVPAREVGTRSADAPRYVLDAPFPLFE